MTLTGTDTRADLIEALGHLRDEADKTKPSPRYDTLHEQMNELLDALVGT